MSSEVGELKTWNPQKEISREITLEILIRHRDALKQARNGQIAGVDMSTIKTNRKIIQVRGLNLIISAQREMITHSRPIIYFRSLQEWKKKRKLEKEKSKDEVIGDDKEISFLEKGDNPLEMKYDYSKLLWWLDFLRECSSAIRNAEKTKRTDDDFLVKKITRDGESFELTNNFYEMLEDLESSYEQIYLLMLTNKIVSTGIEEDDELTYKELEKEAVESVVNL